MSTLPEPVSISNNVTVSALPPSTPLYPQQSHPYPAPPSSEFGVPLLSQINGSYTPSTSTFYDGQGHGQGHHPNHHLNHHLQVGASGSNLNLGHAHPEYQLQYLPPGVTPIGTPSHLNFAGPQSSPYPYPYNSSNYSAPGIPAGYQLYPSGSTPSQIHYYPQPLSHHPQSQYPPPPPSSGIDYHLQPPFAGAQAYPPAGPSYIQQPPSPSPMPAQPLSAGSGTGAGGTMMAAFPSVRAGSHGPGVGTGKGDAKTAGGTGSGRGKGGGTGPGSARKKTTNAGGSQSLDLGRARANKNTPATNGMIRNGEMMNGGAGPVNGNGIPPVPALVAGNGRASVSSESSISGPSSEHLHTNQADPYMTPTPMQLQYQQHLQYHQQGSNSHQRSISDLSHTRSITSLAEAQPSPSKKRKQARGLEIKHSLTEGRRLAFPESTPTPTTASSGVSRFEGLVNLDEEDEEPARGRGEASKREEREEGLPITPRKQIRPSGLVPRLVPAMSLHTTPRGSARVGEKDILATDLKWLQPEKGGKAEGEEDVVPNSDGSYVEGVNDLTLVSPEKTIGPDGEILTRSARKRKRLETFKLLGTSGSTTPSSRSAQRDPSPTPRKSKPTLLQSVGRVALGKEAALRFLGDAAESVPSVSDTTISAATEEDNSSQAGPSSPSRSSPLQTPRPRFEPEWLDDHYPWAEDENRRKKRVEEQEEIDRKKKVALIGRYLDEDSEDERIDGDSRLVLRKIMSHRGVTSATSSDAREAVRHATRHGKSLLERDLEYSTALPIITAGEEAGCLCRGKNQDGGAMVCCDGCTTWYHMSCCGIETEDELDDQWYCIRCEPNTLSTVRGGATPASQEQSIPVPQTPRSNHSLGPTFSATDETIRTYHALGSDAALAPSPIFSPSAKYTLANLDTPAFYPSPRIPSGSSTFSRSLYSGTPMSQSRGRVVSYAEHYNVCQTPGAPQSDYKKVYSTPKFEDLFDSAMMHPGYTPALRNPGSPTPGSRSLLPSDGDPAFTTPTTSQNFFRSLHNGPGSTPALEYLSSAGGPSHSPFPISPADPVPKNTLAISEGFSPSPFRAHRRQVSFGARANFVGGTSQLRDSTVAEAGDRSSSGSDRGAKAGKGKETIRGADLEFGEEL